MGDDLPSKNKNKNTNNSMIVKREDTVGKLTSKDPLPRDRYTIRCVEENFVVSKSSKNPMITREWEICLPETIKVGERTLNVAGTRYIMQYLPTKVLPNENVTEEQAAEKTKAAMDRVFEDYETLGFPTDEGIDNENPELHAKGVVADAILASEESVQRKEPTPEQKAAGQMGDEIKDDDGNAIKSYRVRLVQILGRSTAEVGPY